MTSEVKNLILASLFHDIGKFIQRSKKFEETHEQLSQLFLSVISTQKSKGKKKYQLKFKDQDLDFDLVARLCGQHHSDNFEDEDEKFKKLFQIIKKADNLAAASQREIDQLSKSVDPVKINQKDIFDFLFSKEKPPRNYLHQIHGLYELEMFLPKKEEQRDFINNQACYKDLLGEDNFGALLSGILNSERDFLSFMYAIDDLFHLIYTQIPEDRRDKYQLNSLYDHLKLTTIFAFLLYYGDKFHILKFDIAGIQRFIFDVKSKKATKILRGRSLFIQLLSEIISFDIIKKLELIPQLVLGSYGGNTIIFLPKNQELLVKLKSLLSKWRRYLITHYSLVLRNNNYQREYPINQSFFGEIFSNREINKLNIDKKLFFDLEDINNDIYPISVDDTSLCDFCHNPSNPKISSPDEKICSQCQIFLNLSQFIVKSQPFFWESADKTNIEFKPLSKSSKKENQIIFKPFKNLKKRLEEKRNYYPLSSSKTLFYTVTVPQDKTFEDLVKGKNSAPLLLYLKGDVDNMSLILEKGFDFREENEKTITDVLHFSRRVNLFFQNYLPYLIESQDKFKNEIYLIYSGGDDFFLTGHWQKVLEFVFELKEKFDQFVCFNPQLHFSLGGFLAKDNDPVFLMAEKVEEKLFQAKKMGKNLFSFLYSNLKIEDWKKLYIKAKKINNEAISSSFFYKMFQLADGFQVGEKDYQKAINFYQMSYFYFRLIKSFSDQYIEKNNLNDFIDFFNKIFMIPKEDDQEIKLCKDNFKSFINLILLFRRKGGEKNE